MTKRLFWLAILIIFLGLLYKGARLGWYGWAAYEEVQTLRALGDQAQGAATLNQAYSSLVGLNSALGQLEYEMVQVTPLLERLGWLPNVGPTVAALPELLLAGREGSRVASEGLRLVSQQVSQEAELSPALLLNALEQAQPGLLSLTPSLGVAHAALADIEPDELIPSLEPGVRQAKQWLATSELSLGMIPALPKLLGFDFPQTYLILVQNNQELRATGGFVTAVGELIIEDGTPLDFQFMDSYEIANPKVEHPQLPDPMQEYMGIDLMFLRDVNWSPDLQTTSILAQDLYRRNQGVLVDGVVTVDLQALTLLVDALGPLRVPDYNQPVTGANVLDLIQSGWNQWTVDEQSNVDVAAEDWWTQRKNFMPQLAEAGLARLQGEGVNYAALVAALQKALDQRAIQVWVDDPELMTQLDIIGWAGRMGQSCRVAELQSCNGATDFVGLVDTNMGFNKANAVVERQMRHEVEWPDGPRKPGVATTTILYRHPSQVDDHLCDMTPRYGETYAEMTQRCYFNFVRLYVPMGSELLSAEGVERDSTSYGPGSATLDYFTGYFVLSPGETNQITFRYRLPQTIVPDGYQVMVQRQAGTGPLPVQLQVGDRHMEKLVAAGRWVWSGDDKMTR